MNKYLMLFLIGYVNGYFLLLLWSYLLGMQLLKIDLDLLYWKFKLFKLKKETGETEDEV